MYLFFGKNLMLSAEILFAYYFHCLDIKTTVST